MELAQLVQFFGGFGVLPRRLQATRLLRNRIDLLLTAADDRASLLYLFVVRIGTKRGLCGANLGVRVALEQQFLIQGIAGNAVGNHLGQCPELRYFAELCRLRSEIPCCFNRSASLQTPVAFLDRCPESRLEMFMFASGRLQQIKQPGIGDFQGFVLEELHRLLGTVLAEELLRPIQNLRHPFGAPRGGANLLQQRFDLLGSGEVALNTFQDSHRVVELFGSGHLLGAIQQLTLALLPRVRLDLAVDNISKSLELRISRNRAESILDCGKSLGDLACFQKSTGSKKLFPRVGLELSAL